jgi:hypothetical protein
MLSQMDQDRFLFQFDGAAANGGFAERWQQRHGGVRFAGASMRVGAGWTPDFADVAIDSSTTTLTLRLIELEGTDLAARESCRKYLPEVSHDIVNAFVEYLANVLGRCQASADPRLESFKRLNELLRMHATIIVETAGALHSSPDFLEVFALIDQRVEAPRIYARTSDGERLVFSCENRRSLSREQLEVLLRVIRMLHAVVIGKGHNDGSLDSVMKSLRTQFDAALSASGSPFSELTRLRSQGSRDGAYVDCDKIVAELAELWLTHRADASPDHVRSWIDSFYPYARDAGKRQPARPLFEQARNILEMESRIAPHVIA